MVISKIYQIHKSICYIRTYTQQAILEIGCVPAKNALVHNVRSGSNTNEYHPNKVKKLRHWYTGTNIWAHALGPTGR